MPIAVRGLSCSYFGRQVLGAVSADFEAGLVHLILGATGSGKSTLALVLAGLVKPDAGHVTVDGVDPASDGFDRSWLQLAFQFPEAQIFESSVEKEIEFGIRNLPAGSGSTPEEVRRRRDWAIDCVGLPEALLARDPSTLSFGERRKVALASVVALRPRYLVLDEPLAGLDWYGRHNLVATVLNLRNEGVATLVLTHETDLVAEMGDTVSLVGGGRITGPIKPEELLSSDGKGQSWLLPDFLLAFEALRRRGWVDGRAPRTVEETARVLAQAAAAAGPGRLRTGPGDSGAGTPGDPGISGDPGALPGDPGAPGNPGTLPGE